MKLFCNSNFSRLPEDYCDSPGGMKGIFAIVCLLLLLIAAGCSKEQSPKATQPAAGAQKAASAGGNAAGPVSQQEPSLVSLSSGAFIVQKPQEYSDAWSAFYMIDERSETGWATPGGVTGNQTIVIELPEKTVLSTLEFDTAHVDGEKRGAKDILVEMSDTGPRDGFRAVSEVSLADRADNQVFPVAAQVPGRWVRLTVKNNQGSPEYVEIMDFRAHGKQLTATAFPDVSGTYSTSYNDMHIRQQGTSLTGCYEDKEGVLEGGIEGRVMKLTWREKDNGDGPAVMVFSGDAKQFFGLWWRKGSEKQGGEMWLGTKKSAKVGSCPHWSGGVEEQMAKDLAEFGRTRVYGINFDSDSDRIKDESRPTLDKIVAILKSKPDWKLTIEGHTDSTAGAEHNQQLSERRAKAVQSYLEAAGVTGSRLSSTGFGASRPVAPNDNAIGRAQNRRVELAKM